MPISGLEVLITLAAKGQRGGAYVDNHVGYVDMLQFIHCITAFLFMDRYGDELEKIPNRGFSA